MKVANSLLMLKMSVVVTRTLGRFSARLAGTPASWLWFIPWRLPVSERGLQKQARWLEPTKPFTLRTSVGRVAGFVAGEGPLVMLVHGLGDRAAGLGGFIAPFVEDGFKVVGIDLPGHGDSEGQLTNPILMATALVEVADQFGPPHAVIAHSLGASGALWAMNAGLATNRVVLIAPTVEIDDAMATFQAMFGLPPKAIKGLRRKIESRFGSDIWAEMRGDRLARDLKTPALIFHDPADPQVPFGGSQNLVNAWTGSELIEVPGLGHGAITRDPAVIERAVDFVTEAVRPNYERSSSVH